MKTILFLSVGLLVAVTVSAKTLSPEPKATCVMGTNCNLPDCLCSDIYPPNKIAVSQVPQMVFLTFDDGITVENFPLYERIFNGQRVNPNGAPISGTFFVTHDYNNYSLTHELYARGHDIALHSITHKSDVDYWKVLDATGWAREVLDQKEQMATFARIPAEDIVGFRAPFLQGGGNTMYKVLADPLLGLQYDSSRPTWRLRPLLWPYTADHDTIQDCQIEPCPTDPFPGFWVPPLVDLLGSNESPCAMIDTCLDTPTNVQETYDLLMNNFNAHYEATRAPFGVYTHAAWIQNVDYIEAGYLKFLDEILQNPDVYVVSIKKGLDWMRTPQELSSIDQLPSWGPDPPADTLGCPVNLNCQYDTPPGQPGGQRIMNICGICPKSFPWLGNHLGVN